MKIYLACGSLRKFPFLANVSVQNVRLLLSYYFCKNENIAESLKNSFQAPYPELFLDSGGFTADSKGAYISLDEYCDYIRAQSGYVSAYANLDIISSAKQTYENQCSMEEQGLSPLPVFHVGEDWRYLEMYLERYRYIALVGMVPYARRPKVITPWLVQCFKRAQGRAVYHGFGCTYWETLKNFPWYSADSSTWGESFRYGKPKMFDEQEGRFFRARLGNHMKCYRHAELFREAGYDPAIFAVRELNSPVAIAEIEFYAFLKAERWLEKRHGNITIPEAV